ncbi:MAG: DUF6261 family protein [Candidatus Fibromonas sp.]|jgi:hypothetical protein|nr:DUF6261 family protein [Candidatus Fibromonas sp.]
MKISKIHTIHLRNDEHFQFHTEFRDLVQKETPLKLKIQQQFEAYLPLYGRADEALKKINKSSLTAQIQEADKARDEIFLGMAETAKGALKHFNPEVRAAANRLKMVFDTYGNVAVKPLNEQTSAVYNLLQELQGKYAQDAEAVGITQWAVELQARNNAFSGLMKERFDETASRCDIVLREARVELDQSYFAIREKINALAIVEGEADYENFIRTLNAVIAKYTAILNSRQGKRGKKETENTQTNGGSV